ncbi:uncharacterized protein LOC123319962 [Coccinella septempunctata]|uniref:uncharacterized protein LOC123319962 n=1 Tax=Coccinella septempunctata TaxID=41139 RepID=UPI001D087A37|nr:uncharacterized protein LOC123319962 [Coccinella septempunctata]
MSKRSIDESLRKPRTFAGTPMNKLINRISLGVFACAGLSWYIFEQWSQTKQLHKSLLEGKFDDSPETKYRLDSMKYFLTDPSYYELIVKLQKRTYERERGTKEKPWYVKYLATHLDDDEI